MDLLQTVAFLHWLTGEQPFEDWQHEGFDLTAWIEAQGFDSGLIFEGILELEKSHRLPHGFCDLVAEETDPLAREAWIKAAKKIVDAQNSLVREAGGTGITMNQIHKDYKKSLKNIANHTDQQIAKEIEARVEKELEKQFVEKMDGWYPELSGHWGSLAKAGEEDNKNNTISQQQKEKLSQHGVTTNTWTTPYDALKGKQVNSKNSNYIYVEYNTVNEEYLIRANFGKNKKLYFSWEVPKSLKDETWASISSSLILTDTNYPNPETFSLAKATSYLQEEHKIASNANRIIQTPYVKLALKYDLGSKRYKNLTSIYDAIKYLQSIKFENLSAKNKILFTYAMISFEYDLLEKKFAKYHSSFYKLKKLDRLYSLIDSPDKIFEKTFEFWTIKNVLKRGNHKPVNYTITSRDFQSYANNETEETIIVTNKNTGQESKLEIFHDQGYGFQLLIDKPFHGNDSWMTTYESQWTKTPIKLICDNIANTEKQSKFFKNIKRAWTNERLLVNNINKDKDDPLLARILDHELKKIYILCMQLRPFGKYKHLEYLFGQNYFSKIYGHVRITDPWVESITPKTIWLLFKRLNKVDFGALGKKKQTELLIDLFYVQHRLTPYKHFYSNITRIINKLDDDLQEINKLSTHLVGIAWNQIVKGTYRNKPSLLPLYQRLINRFLIEVLAAQDPKVTHYSGHGNWLYDNNGGVEIELNDADIFYSKDDGEIELNKVDIYYSVDTEGNGEVNYWDGVIRIGNYDFWPGHSGIEYMRYIHPQKFALKEEHKWFDSKQAKWTEQAYTQIEAFDTWYKHVTSFPLIHEILRHDMFRTKYWEYQIKNKTLLYLYNNSLIKDLPSLHAINKTLVLLSKIQRDGLTRKQEKIWHKETKEFKLTIALDILALRATTAVLVKRHRSLLQKINNTANAIEKITPDQIYQQVVDQAFYNKYLKGLHYGKALHYRKELHYGQEYKVPTTNVKFEINYNPRSHKNEIDIITPTGHTPVYVNKESQGWVIEYPGGTLDANEIEGNRLNKFVTQRIIGGWEQSNEGKSIMQEYNKLKNLYDHTKYLFGLAFIPRFDNQLRKELLSTPQIENRLILNIYNQWNKELRIRLGQDLNYFFSLSFRGLSTRKKVDMIVDFYLFQTLELPALRTLVSGRRKAAGKAPIDLVYQRINKLAKETMKITPAEVYQWELENIFNFRWLRKVKDFHYGKAYAVPGTDDKIEIINNLDLHNGEIDVEVIKPNGSFSTIFIGKQPQGWLFDYPQKNLSIEINLKDVNLNEIDSRYKLPPASTSLRVIKSQYPTFAYLAGFRQNSLINQMGRTYTRRHKRIHKTVEWLPSFKRLKNTVRYASNIKFADLTLKEKVILEIDYDKIALAVARHYRHVSTVEKQFLHQDLLALTDLADILQNHKVIPGTHGRIDNYYQAYAKGGTLLKCIFMVKQDIYNIRNPQPHKRKWKQWKTWNERIRSAMTLDREILFISHVEKKFFTIEENALSAAYTTYTDSIKSGYSSKQSLKYADRAYINSLLSQDLLLNQEYNKAKGKLQSISIHKQYEFLGTLNIKLPNNWTATKTVNFADEKAEQLAKDAEDWIFYRELVTSIKLLHIQNDRFARKLRLEKFLIKNILEDRLAEYGINQYSSSYQKLCNSLKRGHFYHFFVDLGLAAWDLVKAPFLIVIDPWIYFFKDGDGFLSSIDKGLEAGIHSVKKSINFLADDVKDLFFLADGLLIDVAWLGTHSVFSWVRNMPKLKKFDDGIMKAIFYVEMGSVFIAKSILEMPLMLSKDVNKMLIGLAYFAEGKITFKQMIGNDIRPFVKTIDRLAKFTYHLFTDPKIIKHKAGEVYNLFKFMKEEKEIRYVKHLAKVDRDTRRRLHKDTFGIIKSPYQKFKQRHATQYHYLQNRNALLNENGYFNTHAEAAFGEAQLKAIYNAQVKLNQLSNKTDYQKATYQLKTQFNIDRKEYTTTQQLEKFQKFKSDSSQKQSELVKHFIIKDFVTYFNISANLKSVKNEDKHDIHGYIEKNKLHVANFLVNRLNNWMHTVVQRQLRYIRAYNKFYKNHPKYAADLLELDELSALFAAIKKEQKTINSEWKLWGEHDGKMLFRTLTNWVLPGFKVVKTASHLFGLSLPFTVIGSDGKIMTKAQQKKIQTYDNKHHVGEKLFEMIMWTIFLKKQNDKHPQRLPGLLWFTDFKPLDPLSPLDPYYNKISESYKKREKNHIVKTYKQDYNAFVNTYSYYRRVSKTLKSIFTPYLRKNNKTFHDLLQYQVKSLKTYNAKLKKFSENTNVTGLYKSLFQQVVQYDYNNKIYRGTKGNNGWLAFMQKNKQKQLNYLQEDIYVLTYQAEVEHETVTIGDVLKTFTTKGEKNTNEIYSKLVAPPQHQQSNAAIPSIKTLEREIRVNPINVFKNYEFLKHIGKALANKTAKADAKKAKDIAIVDVEKKEKIMLSNQFAEETEVLKSDSLTLIEDDAQTEVADMEYFIEEEESAVMSQIDVDINIIEDP